MSFLLAVVDNDHNSQFVCLFHEGLRVGHHLRRSERFRRVLGLCPFRSLQKEPRNLCKFHAVNFFYFIVLLTLVCAKQGKDGYGKRKHKVLPEGEAHKIHDFSCFDKDDPMQHMEKVMIGNGIHAGLRGVSEHCTLQCSMIVSGVYEKGHEFKGMRWAGLDQPLEFKQRVLQGLCSS